MDKTVTMWGVWIPGEGWLVCKNDLFADFDLEKARQVARLVGKGAKVLYIDDSIIELQSLYLEQEKRTLWQNFKTLFSRKD